ncbi:MAG: SNF2-related protein, partial [Actinomycetia bacterium]|nr:SNF2-related protein [Actinomycetes bacterium]
MLVAHATWHGGALCLWAERSGPYDAATAGLHPYATTDFTATSYEPYVRMAPRIKLTMLLPTGNGHPLPSPELGPEPYEGEPELSAWLVPALLLAPFQAMALLQAAEEIADVIPGTDLRFFSLIGEEAAELVRRGQVLPALLREDGDLTARWRPVLDDAPRFRELATAMPSAARAAEGGQPAGQVLREALDGLVDTAVRGVAAHPLLPERKGKVPDRLPLAERWLAALTGPSPHVAREIKDDADDLIAELAAWARAARKPSGPLRVCFRLIEPGAKSLILDPAAAQDWNDEPWNDEAWDDGIQDEPEEQDNDLWRVEFALQGTEDLSLLVSAASVWSGEAALIDAEETLLAGLGRALRLFPDMKQALNTAAPAEAALDTAGAFRFLRQAAPLLNAAGFGVLLPTWAGSAKLGLKLTTTSEDTADAGAATPSGFGLQQLVQFRWDLAIGDDPINEDELAELARLKAPLVRLRGQWVELDDQQLEAALEFMRHPRTGKMSAAQAMSAVMHAGAEALPLLAVDADGALGDLLSGQADRRLEPMGTPEGIEAQLRPYQERGLAWLTFMSDLGLGALLADDMGLGKTISALALLVHERETLEHVAPTLAVLPMSLVGNWQRETAKFAPKLKVYVHHGTGRHRDEDLVEAVKQA